MYWKTKIRSIKEKYLYSLLFMIVLLFIWQFLTTYFTIPEYILPSPYKIALAFKKSGFLLNHTFVTLSEIISGFVIGAVLGFILAVGIFLSKFLYRTIYPLIICIGSIPKLALAPLLIIWLGFGTLPKIIITALIVFFPVVLNSLKGLMFVQPELIDLMKSVRASKRQVLFKIRLPLSLPYLFASLKISITLAVVGAVISEFMGSDMGLGYVIMVSSVNLNTSLMFAALILLGLLGLFLFVLVSMLEMIILPWHMGSGNN